MYTITEYNYTDSKKKTYELEISGGHLPDKNKPFNSVESELLFSAYCMSDLQVTTASISLVKYNLQLDLILEATWKLPNIIIMTQGPETRFLNIFHSMEIGHLSLI